MNGSTMNGSKGIARDLLSLGLASACLAALTGCFGLQKSENQPTPAKEAAATGVFYGSGEAAFKATVYKLATKNCSGCHGVSQAPVFATKDVNSAYAALLGSGKIDFPNCATSALTLPTGKLADSHCGSYCDGHALAEWQEAIKAWWWGGECLKTGACATKPGNAGDVSQIPSDRLVTGQLLVPANLPTGANFATLTFPLGGTRAELEGANLVIEIQQYSNSNGYLLRRPRLTFGNGANFAIYINDIQVAINGVPDANATTYKIVEAIVSNPGGQFLSGSPLITTMVNGPGQDKLSITFGDIVRSATACKNLATFVSSVRPILTSNNCVGCHSAQQTFTLNTAINNEVLCARALERSNLATPASSPLIRLPFYKDPTRMGNAHPNTNMSAAQVNTIIQWIDSE